jgi:cation diffusion facilitator family transporter
VTSDRPLELPPDRERLLARAVVLEWVTLAYMVSAVVLLYLTLGNSQALKAAWLEDLLGLLPPMAFLVAARIRRRKPDRRFPWGYHRAVSVAYLVASTALLGLGSWVLIESVLKLLTAERPPIGVVSAFGGEIWLGWLMLPALAWSAIPAAFLGQLKLPLASELHDKVLYADAKMNKANWLTAGAAMIGVLGIGLGLWWADAVAAIAISLDIIRDGGLNLRAAVLDLMDETPTKFDGSGPHPLQAELEQHLTREDWISESRVRLREEGHVFTGEALIVPRSDDDLTRRVAALRRELVELDWKLHDLVVAPVPDLHAGRPGGGEDADDRGAQSPSRA